MLDVVCDLWHPESNPAGYVSLGVAENVRLPTAQREKITNIGCEKTLMHKELIEYMTKTVRVVSSLTRCKVTKTRSKITD